MWISADSILKERSTLNIESKIGFANELGGTLIDVLVAHCPSFVRSENLSPALQSPFSHSSSVAAPGSIPSNSPAIPPLATRAARTSRLPPHTSSRHTVA